MKTAFALVCLTLAFLVAHSWAKKENAEVSDESCTSMVLILNEGQDDYAACAGTYTKSMGVLRDRPLWLSEELNRVIFYTGDTYTINSISNHLVTILYGYTRGFYFAQRGDSAEPYEADWSPRYSVECE